MAGAFGFRSMIILVQHDPCVVCGKKVWDHWYDEERDHNYGQFPLAGLA